MRIEDAGGARTLVVDETFASFYRPGELATGCVWDAIAAPLLWLPPRRRRKILILGLGGGSVARLARAIAPEAEIVGVMKPSSGAPVRCKYAFTNQPQGRMYP